MWQPSKLSHLPIDFIDVLDVANRNVDMSVLCEQTFDSGFALDSTQVHAVSPVLSLPAFPGNAGSLNYVFSGNRLLTPNHQLDLGIDLAPAARPGVYHYLFQIAFNTNFAQAHAHPFVCVLPGAPDRRTAAGSLVNGTGNVTSRFRNVAGQGWSDRGNMAVHSHVVIGDEEVHTSGRLVFGAQIKVEQNRSISGDVTLSLFRWAEDVRSFDPNLG